MSQNKKYFLLTLGIVLIVGVLAYSILIFIESRKSNQTQPLTNYKEKTSEISTSIEQKNQSENYISKKTDNILLIPKINVSAPINLNVSGNIMEEYMKSLETGVAHMAKTALPGDYGNSVIFGHSSYYPNKPGDYKEIFSKLDDLTEGDIIKIENKQTQLTYKVTEKKIIDPKDISVVNQDTSNKKITLITCWPPKTTNNRLIVVAKYQ